MDNWLATHRRRGNSTHMMAHPAPSRVGLRKIWSTPWIQACLLSPLVGLLAGASACLFLFLLEKATLFRLDSPFFFLGLPFLGLAFAWLYMGPLHEFESGLKIVFREIHHPKKFLSWVQAPTILLSTLASHIFGASVGREGTALQMSAPLSDLLSRLYNLSRDTRRLVLISSLAAGFGAVFGTPWTGIIFSIEVCRPLRRQTAYSLLPCALSAFIGDSACRHLGLVLGVDHMALPKLQVFDLHPKQIVWLVICALLFGLTSRAFLWLHTELKKYWHKIKIFKNKKHNALALGFLGGLVLLGVFSFQELRTFAGLGTWLIQDAFTAPAPLWSFATKLLVTSLSLAFGFKGGEVTPLFCIGALLGSGLAQFFGLPMDLLAAAGLIAVFAGATNTPLACTVLGIELFGFLDHPAKFLVFLSVNFVSVWSSGKRSIYPSSLNELL